jgi:hypothetical protein
VVYSFLAGAGLDMVAEDYTSHGRIDLALFYEGRAYLLEFKVVELEGETPKALSVLKEKKYYEKYIGKYSEIYLIGIDFSRESKNILNFEWEKL